MRKTVKDLKIGSKAWTVNGLDVAEHEVVGLGRAHFDIEGTDTGTVKYKNSSEPDFKWEDREIMFFEPKWVNGKKNVYLNRIDALNSSLSEHIIKREDQEKKISCEIKRLATINDGINGIVLEIAEEIKKGGERASKSIPIVSKDRTENC